MHITGPQQILLSAYRSGLLKVNGDSDRTSPDARIGPFWEAYRQSCRTASHAGIADATCMLMWRQCGEGIGIEASGSTSLQATSLGHLSRFEDPSLTNPADFCGPRLLEGVRK